MPRRVFDLERGAMLVEVRNAVLLRVGIADALTPRQCEAEQGRTPLVHPRGVESDQARLRFSQNKLTRIASVARDEIYNYESGPLAGLLATGLAALFVRRRRAKG
jgi:MYXO-CTERM domain-containing protein